MQERGSECQGRSKSGPAAPVEKCPILAAGGSLWQATVDAEAESVGRGRSGDGRFNSVRHLPPGIPAPVNAVCGPSPRWPEGDRSGDFDALCGHPGVEVFAAEAVTVALEREDLAVVDEPVDHRGGGHVVAEDLAPR